MSFLRPLLCFHPGCWFPALILALAGSANPIPGHASSAAPIFEYHGQFGDVHTPFTDHDIREFNRRGEFIGVSTGRAGGRNMVSAWVARPDGLQERLGFFGPPFVSPTNEFLTFPINLTESGYIIGASTRYQPAGRIAWSARTDGVTRRVGYYDALHTDPMGAQYSWVQDINEWALMLGSSTRFVGGVEAGSTLWIALPNGYIRPIGLYDARHTRGGGAQGYKFSAGIDLNERGIVAGYSESFVRPNETGATAWFANARGQTYRIGYYDPRHTASDGHQWSLPTNMNQAGEILGFSERFVGFGGIGDFGEVIGRSAWLATTAGEIRRLGLFDSLHKGLDDFHLHTAGALTESGFITGSSARLDRGLTGAQGSESAWIANRQGVTQVIGFYDADHTRTDGLMRSVADHLNESGVVAGQSHRFAGFEDRGSSAWLSRFGGPIVRVGLYDAAHTSPSGRCSSVVRYLAPNNTVIGSSARFGFGDGIVGETFWIGDFSGRTVPIAETSGNPNFDSNAAGYVWTPDWVYNTNTRQLIHPGGRVYGVSTSGVIYGRGNNDRAFAWIPGRGYMDLATNVDTPLSEDGWEQWFDTIATNPTGFIAGRGWLAGTNREHHLVFLVRVVD